MLILDRETNSAAACPKCGDALVPYSAPEMSTSHPAHLRWVFEWDAPRKPVMHDEAESYYSDDIKAKEMTVQQVHEMVEQEQEEFERIDSSTLCVLHKGKYLCPACQRMTLMWINAGVWD